MSIILLFFIYFSQYEPLDEFYKYFFHIQIIFLSLLLICKCNYYWRYCKNNKYKMFKVQNK